MDTLPEELLCRIIKEVGSWTSAKKLPLVSKKFARIATPLLYDKIKVNYRYLEYKRAAKRLLDTLIVSPELRSLCHHLDVFDWQTIYKHAKDPNNVPISLVDLSDAVRQTPGLASFPLEWQRRFGADILQSVPDAILAATLTLLPNLHRLTMRVNQRYNWPQNPNPSRKDLERTEFTPLDFNHTFTMRLIELSSTPSLKPFCLFSQLTRVWISDGGEHLSPGWDTNLISFFFRLPALKIFRGDGCRDGAGDEYAEDKYSTSKWDCGYGVSHVTSIELNDCKIGAGSISSMLRSCKALETFRLARPCKNCWDTYRNNSYNPRSYARIHHDLNRHKESLHTLRLQSQYCQHSSSRDTEPIETLAQLTNLRRLEVDDDALFGKHAACSGRMTDFLPPNLQDITIYGEDERSQQGTFREAGRFLLSDPRYSAVRFESACIGDAEEILEKLPGIAVEEVSERRDDYCDFLMYRPETTQKM